MDAHWTLEEPMTLMEVGAIIEYSRIFKETCPKSFWLVRLGNWARQPTPLTLPFAPGTVPE